MEFFRGLMNWSFAIFIIYMGSSLLFTDEKKDTEIAKAPKEIVITLKTKEKLKKSALDLIDGAKKAFDEVYDDQNKNKELKSDDKTQDIKKEKEKIVEGKNSLGNKDLEPIEDEKENGGMRKL